MQFNFVFQFFKRFTLLTKIYGITLEKLEFCKPSPDLMPGSKVSKNYLKLKNDIVLMAISLKISLIWIFLML